MIHRRGARMLVAACAAALLALGECVSTTSDDALANVDTVDRVGQLELVEVRRSTD